MLKIIILLLLPTLVQARGASGTYYIKGIAYGVNKSIIKDVTIQVKTGEKTFLVYIDANGSFSIPVDWRVPCTSGPAWNKRKRSAACRKNNPEFIYISWGSHTTRISNKWKKYGNPFSTEEERTWHRDLRF